MAKPHSLHTFLFPFKWEIKQGDDRNKQSLEERTDLYSIEKLLPEGFWNRFKYEFTIDQEANTYNEHNYFYDYVRDVLHLDPEQTYINGLQYGYARLQTGATYKIQILGGPTTNLVINGITLNFLESGVGAMTFHLQNFETNNFETILKINEYGRRIYPQFLGANIPFTEATKNSFLANSITLEQVMMPDNSKATEDFTYYDDFTNIRTNPIRLPNFIGGLLGDNFSTGYSLLKTGQTLLTPIIDDRMFVMCMLFDKALLLELKEYNKELKEYSYENNTKWYRFLFVDDSTASCQSNTMMPSLLKKHTYDRWIGSVEKNMDDTIKHHSGQLFGISRYSFVCLVGDGYFNENILGKHFNSIYFQLMFHALIQRAYVINFSSEVARITYKLGNRKVESRKSSEDISKLYLLYIKFVNRIYFREVTPQEQGIELYDKLLEHMRVKEDVSDLKEEIMELNSYVDTMQQKELNRIAATYLPITLLASLLGMATIEKFNTITWAGGKEIDWQLTLLMISTIAIIGISLYLIIRKLLNLK